MTNRTLYRILIAAVAILKRKKIMISFRFHLNKPNTCAETLIGHDEAWLVQFLNYQIGFVTEANTSFLCGIFLNYLLILIYIFNYHRKERVKSETSIVCYVMTGCSPGRWTFSQRRRCWKGTWWRMLQV